MIQSHTLSKLSLAVVLLTVTACLKASSPLFSVSSSGAVLTIATTVPNHTYSAAGIKITSPGYSLANPGSECTPSANGYCLFSVSNTVAHDITISGAAGSVSYTLCLNGSSATSCQTYRSTVSPGPSVAYVVNNGTSQVLLCPIEDGAFGHCTSTGSDFNYPYNIAINAAGTKAYITDSDASTGDGSVSYCTINPDQSLGSCQKTITTGFYMAIGIALNTANTFVYGTDSSGGTVFRCPINSVDGSVGTCVDSGEGAAFNGPTGIVINAASTTAYVVNNGTSNVSVCSVALDGSLSDCHDSYPTGVPLSYPASISLSADGTQAYIANGGNDTVSICSIVSGGDLGTCTTASNTGSGFQGPHAVGLSGSSNAYVVNTSSNSVYQCPLTMSGFGNCQDSGNSGTSFSQPWGIALK